MKEHSEKPRKTIAELMEQKGFDADHVAESALTTIEELQHYLSGQGPLEPTAMTSVIKLLHAEQYEIVHPADMVLVRNTG